MARFFRPKAPEAAPLPRLDLSGPVLRRAFEHLVDAAEGTGGVERYVSALALKSSLFQELFGGGDATGLTLEEFRDLGAFIAPARRRLGAELVPERFARLRDAVSALIASADPATADARLGEFVLSFPADRAYRWVRDLGAEILHFTFPQTHPLMTRWMWDAEVGTGVLREIWFNEPGAPALDAGDGLATFAALAEELAGFLSDNGVFRDHGWYGDLLCAHVYADYINDQGGQYLRADFSDGSDPMLHTRRMLGLDAINTETGRTRLKLIDGTAHVLGGDPLLLGQS